MHTHNDPTSFAARFDRGEIEWNADDCVIVVTPAAKPIPPKPVRPVASFAPDAMSTTEARTNSGDAFAAIREVDTTRFSRNDLRRMMTERFRSGR